jgi:hypothetical protein
MIDLAFTETEGGQLHLIRRWRNFAFVDPGCDLTLEAQNEYPTFWVLVGMPLKPTRPPHSAKNVTGDFGQFTNFMKRLVSVPHSEIKAKLDAEKQAKQQQKKRPSSSRASHAKD